MEMVGMEEEDMTEMEDMTGMEVMTETEIGIRKKIRASLQRRL
jgi:hypothetical protein